ncbi:MAG: cupin domain-containing protein [Bryobacter sp.]|nr:cupin domain-containing protein [Bryobacter sp.]
MNDITIQRNGAEAAKEGPAEYFSGEVELVPLVRVLPPSRLAGLSVRFAPGARTAWHTHPLGQTLLVTEGTGWVQQWGEARQEIQVGDVVRIPPGNKHWHGATATTSMTHLALQEELDGKSADWLELVTDEQYLGSEG